MRWAGSADPVQASVNLQIAGIYASARHGEKRQDRGEDGPFLTIQGGRGLLLHWLQPSLDCISLPTTTIPPNSSKMTPKRQKISDDDPLTRAIAPPPNETSADRELRIAAEQEAKRVSDTIDEELNRQRIADKKYPKPVKILLLGASPVPSALPPCSATAPLWQVRVNLVCRYLLLVIPTERLLCRKIYHAQE